MKVKLKNINIESGKPKIAVSLITKSIDEMIKEVKFYDLTSFDILEWRADYFDDILDLNQVSIFLIKLNEILNNKPIIFTFRSIDEGGVRKIDEEEYININRFVLETKLVDCIDLEYFMGENILNRLIGISRKNNIKVIISNHNFIETPKDEIILNRLNDMKKHKPDILKLAFMPKNKLDSLEILKIGLIFNELNDIPMILISMGSDGMCTRFLGEIFNSTITFASISKTSAPGQINVKDTNELLSLINKVNS